LESWKLKRLRFVDECIRRITLASYNNFNDQEIATTTYDWIKDSREADKDWREFSEKVTKYYLGRQWSPTDKSIMQDTKRAALTINQLRSLVKLVTGYQRQNRYPIRVYGQQAEDQGTAAVLEELIQNITASQLYQYQDSQRFLHGLVTGRGWMFGKMDYSDDWLGEIKLHSRVNPRHVYYDRMSRDLTLQDAEYVVWVELLRESGIRHLIGDKDIADMKMSHLRTSVDWEQDFDPQDWPVVGAGQYAGNPADRWYNKKSTSKVPKGAFYKVGNAYYRTWENEYFIADRMSGQLQPVEDKKKGEAIVMQMPNDVMMVQRRVQKIKSALVVGDTVIDHKESTTGHKILPLIPYFSGFYMGETFGLLDDLLDVQDFLNKRFSNYSHILNTTANPGWIGDEDAVENWSEFRKEASKPGPVIRKKSGKMLERLEGGNLPTAEVNGLSGATELMKVVSGINPDMIGQADKDTSGRAIMLRQQQGYQILAENIDNHRLSTVQTTQFMIDAIQNNYNYEKTFRVLLPDQQVQYLTLNQRIPDMMGAVDEILNDVSMGTYDVIVSDQAISPSMRYLHFQELIEIVRETGVGIPPQVLVKASNLPMDMKQEIIQSMSAPAPMGDAGTGSLGGPGQVPNVPEEAMG
jgi:hypothetical protein